MARPVIAPQVRVISDGTPHGTRVYVDDKEIVDVISVTLKAAAGNLPTAVLELDHVAIDVVGQLRDAIPAPEPRKRYLVVGANQHQIKEWSRTTGVPWGDVITATPGSSSSGRGTVPDVLVWLPDWSLHATADQRQRLLQNVLPCIVSGTTKVVGGLIG